jgi:hypothetical protein
MSVFNLAIKTAGTIGLLILSPLTIPVIGDVSKPAVKAVIKAGLIVYGEGKKLFDEAISELEKEAPSLLGIGERVTEEIATELVESLIEEEAETAVGSVLGEIIEEVAVATVGALL